MACGCKDRADKGAGAAPSGTLLPVQYLGALRDPLIGAATGYSYGRRDRYEVFKVYEADLLYAPHLFERQ